MRTRGRGIVALAMALSAGALVVGCGGGASRAQSAYWNEPSSSYRSPLGETLSLEATSGGGAAGYVTGESFAETEDEGRISRGATGFSTDDPPDLVAGLGADVDRLLDQAMTSEAPPSTQYEEAPEPPPQPQYAQATPEAEEPTATDATAQALLVYTARLTMAVHEVNENQERVIEIARTLGGHLSVRTDDTVEIRVPARSFDDAMGQIQELGDVTSRNVQVLDVSEEFRDLETRIHTLEVMRARVEQLLQQAQGVEAALAVEQHLERITVELERLRGRVRYLADRVAFSTITVRFGARTDQTAPAFRLPFSWLQSLGLDSLMSL